MTPTDTSVQAKPLSRSKLRRIIKSRHGEMSQIANSLGISVVSISNWLINERAVSRRIEQAIRLRAAELQQESQHA